jgi:hypothetical protein
MRRCPRPIFCLLINRLAVVAVVQVPALGPVVLWLCPCCFLLSVLILLYSADYGASDAESCYLDIDRAIITLRSFDERVDCIITG